ncbi:MAG TPA: putative toxin-antitoxin system toxin component, PIN family [Gemmatimonadaceae bacterium]
MRVCLDTNVLVAAFATRGLCADVLRTVLAEHDLVIGDVILAELRRVLSTKFKVPADRLDAVDAVFAPFPVIPKPDEPATSAIRDAADRWIVATAVAGNADVLVTGDRDLLDVQAQLPIRTLDPRAFWELLRVPQG